MSEFLFQRLVETLLIIPAPLIFQMTQIGSAIRPKTLKAEHVIAKFAIRYILQICLVNGLLAAAANLAYQNGRHGLAATIGLIAVPTIILQLVAGFLAKRHDARRGYQD